MNGLGLRLEPLLEARRVALGETGELPLLQHSLTGQVQSGTKLAVNLSILKLLEVFLREMVVHPRLVAIQRLKRAGDRLTDFVSVEVRATATGRNLDGKFHANLLDKDIVADLTCNGRASLHGEARDSLVSDAKGSKDAWRELNAVVRVR